MVNHLFSLTNVLSSSNRRFADDAIQLVCQRERETQTVRFREGILWIENAKLWLTQDVAKGCHRSANPNWDGENCSE